MEIVDHRKNLSWCRGAEARPYQARQKELIDSGNFEAVQQMDIDDIKSQFPGMYDQTIDEMIEAVNR